MSLLYSLLIALVSVIYKVIGLFNMIIIIRALISWVNPDPYNPIVQFLQKVTEPILDPIRRYMPRMNIDLSPIVALLVLSFFQKILLVHFGPIIL